MIERQVFLSLMLFKFQSLSSRANPSLMSVNGIREGEREETPDDTFLAGRCFKFVPSYPPASGL
jgi:hypothetical protein